MLQTAEEKGPLFAKEKRDSPASSRALNRLSLKLTST
jgi:hypothetical protein